MVVLFEMKTYFTMYELIEIDIFWVIEKAQVY